MTYPRDPIGLDWRGHYTMADQVYAAYINDRTPLHRVMPERASDTTIRPLRGYASKYVGVIKMKGKFYAVWGRGKDERSGPFPLDDDGELRAATARAQALWRDWLEERENNIAIPPPSPTSGPHSASQDTPRNVSRRKLGGKRVA